MSKNYWNSRNPHWTRTKKAKSFFTITGNKTEPNKLVKKTILEKLRERSKELKNMSISNLRHRLSQNIKGLSPNKNQNPILAFIKTSISSANRNNKTKTNKPNPRAIPRARPRPTPLTRKRREALEKNNPAELNRIRKVLGIGR
jgi:hypothetical protein